MLALKTPSPVRVAPVRPCLRRILPVQRVYPVTHDIVELSYSVGKGVTLFTMFYCTLNGWHYKRLREDHEDAEDKD